MTTTTTTSRFIVLRDESGTAQSKAELPPGDHQFPNEVTVDEYDDRSEWENVNVDVDFPGSAVKPLREKVAELESRVTELENAK